MRQRRVLGQVLEKVLEKFQPQQAAPMDDARIATIVAAGDCRR
jgi:hypothetical protein